eukprot:1145926-Pelagomonas_calceolata.AAC.1
MNRWGITNEGQAGCGHRLSLHQSGKRRHIGSEELCLPTQYFGLSTLCRQLPTGPKTFKKTLIYIAKVRHGQGTCNSSYCVTCAAYKGCGLKAPESPEMFGRHLVDNDPPLGSCP